MRRRLNGQHSTNGAHNTNGNIDIAAGGAGIIFLLLMLGLAYGYHLDNVDKKRKKIKRDWHKY